MNPPTPTPVPDSRPLFVDNRDGNTLDTALREILQKLRPLLEPPPPPPKPEIGFYVKEDTVPYRVRKRQKA